MKIKFLLIIVFCFKLSFAQKQGNVWWLGTNRAIDFNSGIPQQLTFGSSISSAEGTTTISDSSGNLLFYCNGQQIMNKNFQIMPNGDSLLGNISSTQSAIIIPKPGSSRFFYVFTVDDSNVDHYRYGFRYSIVDNCLDNGLGDIIQNQKNILLLDTVEEKVAAVRHSNGIDYWIITHKGFSNEFYSYLLTSNGITDTVITHIGSIDSCGQGQLKISPNGERLANASDQAYTQFSNYFELYDFDKSSGIISHLISLAFPTNKDIYGVEFSPDNSKLYASYGGPVSPFGMGIVEYNLDSLTQTAINNSMTTVYWETQVLGLTALQLGPNGKIYQPCVTGYLLAINSPNNYGPLCGIDDSAVFITGGTIGSPPTLIANYDYSNGIMNCSEGIEEVNNISSSAQLFQNFPDPFSGNTKIRYYIPQNAVSAEMLFFDEYGNKISTSSLIERGNFGELNIDASTLASGTYLYSLVIDGIINSSKHMVHTK